MPLAIAEFIADHFTMNDADSPRPRSPYPRPGPRTRPPAAERKGPPPGAVSPWVSLRSATQHPFIYKRMIAMADNRAHPGDVVNVYDKNGYLFGRGLYNPRSQIVLRMLSHGPAPIDDAFWQTSIAGAVDLRRMLNLDEATDAYRLVHAEGDGLSGLIVERYADCLVFEMFSLGMFQRVPMLRDALAAALGVPTSLDRPGRASPTWRVVVRADEHVERLEGFRVPPPGDDAPKTVTIREHGIRYRVDLESGHKTGFFCDQRDNRRAFAGFCRDADVLDVCSYTGGFGLCAKILGKAKSVTSVDLDEAALAVAKENANLNNTRIDHVHSDAFVYLRQMLANKRTFDAVVLDPPKLAPNRESVEDAVRKYYDLNAVGAQVVRSGGLLLTCSCSGLVSPQMFEDIVLRAVRRPGKTVQILNQTGAGPDHPVSPACPESSYLKALWLRIV